MRNLADALDELDGLVERAVREASDPLVLSGVDDGALLDAAATTARLQRRLDALMVQIIGEVEERVVSRGREERITTQFGCRNVSELVQRATRCSSQIAAGYLRVARRVHRATAISSGELLPPDLPALRMALLEGEISVDAFGSVLGPLADLERAVGREVLLQADAHLASAARGTADALRLGAYDLRILAQVLAAYLDPDGAEPRDQLAQRKRGITFGTARDGIVPFSGALLPDIAAQFLRICDSLLNPKGDGVAAPRFVDSDKAVDERDERLADPRSRAQQQHDVLGTVLTVAARSAELPTIGGAAPTLIVSVRAEDLDAGTGIAALDGVDEPVPIDVARHTACAGSIHRVVFGDGGRILSLGVTDRAFTHHQRKAIGIRDGGCLIPGCHVPAGWCELHHVEEHSRGGPTHTDNGVMVGWWHHRNLRTGGWEIRMNRGVPEVRGPTHWDHYRHWRPVTKSLPRQLDQLSRPE